MAFADALHITSAIFSLTGAVFFAIGVLEVKKPDLVWLAVRMYGAGEQLSLGMRAQQIDFIFGIIFICISLITQSLISESIISNIGKPTSQFCLVSYGLSILALLLVSMLGWYVLRRASIRKLKEAIQKREESSEKES